MSEGDLIALAGYLLALVATLALVDMMRRRAVPAPYTRKVVHVLAGLSPLYVTYFASSKWAGLLPYLLTLLLNLVAWRSGWLRALHGGRRDPGIVYFALIQTVLLAWLWQPAAPSSGLPVALAALLTLALGDAAAALVGERFGRHRYILFGQHRSLEGSGAMLVVSVLVIGSVLFLTGTPRATPATLLGAGTATLVEGLSPNGLDNLTVPLAVAVVLLIVAV